MQGTKFISWHRIRKTSDFSVRDVQACKKDDLCISHRSLLLAQGMCVWPRRENSKVLASQGESVNL